MKQRILLIVAMLLIAAPAFATIDINCTPGPGTSGNNKLTVTYKCNGGEAVRAFALDFNLGPTSPGQVLWSEVNDFNRGESNKPGGGYGIFPGQFRNQIDPANPNWFATYYYPVAPSGDVDSNGTGIGTRKVICELGSLYKDANAPGSSGKLFTLLADPNGQQQVGLTVTTNTVRGKVVLENGTSVDPTITFPNPWKFVSCPSAAPATLTYPAADANNGRYQVSWSAAADATGYRLDRSNNAGSTWTAIYSGTATTVCDDVNAGSYRYRVAATAAGCPDVCNTGSTDCAVVLCFPTADPNMTTWKAQGKPRCWCYQRQCKGDATGTSEGTTKTGVYWVGVPDLNIFMKAYMVKEPTFGVGLKGEPNICADFSHTSEGTTKTGIYRVGVPDLNIFMKAYMVKEPTFGSGIGTCPAGASGSRFTLPADNKPCN
ncbi:MAG: hypothetical protein ABSH16_07220 [Sedimentisphaerales bacterium]